MVPQPLPLRQAGSAAPSTDGGRINNAGTRTGGSQQAAACAAVAVLLAAVGWQVMHLHGWQVLQLLRPPPAGVGADDVKAVKLQYPIWWHAPFYTGTGKDLLSNVLGPPTHPNTGQTL